MTIIIPIVAFLLVLAFVSLAYRLFHLQIFQFLGYIPKFVIAFLAGFIVFILFYSSDLGIGQRISVIIASLLLIYANLSLRIQNDEQ